MGSSRQGRGLILACWGKRPLGGSLKKRQDVEGFAPFLYSKLKSTNNINV